MGAVGGEGRCGRLGKTCVSWLSLGRAGPFPGSPLRMQTGAERRGFHTCRVKDLARSSPVCMPGCRMPLGALPAAPFLPLLCLLVTPRVPSSESLPRGSRDIKTRNTSLLWVAVKERAADLSFPSWAACPLGCPIEERSRGSSQLPLSAGHPGTACCSLPLLQSGFLLGELALMGGE